MTYFSFEDIIPYNYNIAIIISILLSFIIFPWFDIAKWDGPTLFSSVYKLIAAWITVITILILFAFLLKISANFSRSWVVIWTLFGSVILIFMRWSVYYGVELLFKQGWHENRIIIIGTGTLGKQLVQNIKTSKFYTNVEVVAFFDDNKKSPIKTLENIPIIHNISTLASFVENNKINEVLVTPQNIEISYLETVLHQLRYQLVIVRFVANLLSFRLINASIANKYGLPVITLVESPMTKGINRFLKFIEDKLIASLIILLISPLMLVIASGIKLNSPGPIFFCQERVGWNGQLFMMFKFRSMPMDAEKETGPVWNKMDDQRATRFGHFLRKTSLDELPQFWNVLKGDMSIVGPRPERPYFVEQFKAEIPNYMQKHLVKAGITGWAQVNGWRGNTDLRQRIEHDIFYIENWSILFDFQIIVMTIFKGFFNKNAY
ncbi:undecaprenyl-phosphate glucose phosphotransferase [Thiotrichales bacterium HSG14]|nr:undecaprenyl-phosphate glucose phosphotransferase [Thiotrichales bacterium HSG14]